ncbi:MAG: alpha/beta fold hydrolase [Bacteroidota bacterium]|nr:alpha/beta fold hydrolase [Bacteroidota bacterium]
MLGRMTVLIAAVCAVAAMQCTSDGGKKHGTGIRNTAVPPAEARVVSAVPQTQSVSMKTEDGVILAGTLYAAKSTAPAVLCLHQWRSDRSAYAALASALQGEGFTVLTIDMRGHGGSVSRADGGKVAPDRNALPDVAAAVAFLRKHPSVDRSRIAIIGASYGASNAIRFAAGDGGVKAVVLYSPGINYFNVLPIEDAVRGFKGAVFAAASNEDVRSADAVKKIDEWTGGRATTKLFDNAGHGTDMLGAGVGLTQTTIAFLKENL